MHSDVKSAETGTCPWKLEVKRGGNCLIVKIGNPGREAWEMVPLAGTLRTLLDTHRTYRLVLEMHEISLLSSTLIGELVAINNWIHEKGGGIRMCGLSSYDFDILRRLRLDNFFSTYADCRQAVSEPYGWPHVPAG